MLYCVLADDERFLSHRHPLYHWIIVIITFIGRLVHFLVTISRTETSLLYLFICHTPVHATSHVPLQQQ